MAEHGSLVSKPVISHAKRASKRLGTRERAAQQRRDTAALKRQKEGGGAENTQHGSTHPRGGADVAARTDTRIKDDESLVRVTQSACA